HSTICCHAQRISRGNFFKPSTWKRDSRGTGGRWCVVAVVRILLVPSHCRAPQRIATTSPWLYFHFVPLYAAMHRELPEEIAILEIGGASCREGEVGDVVRI